MITLRVELGRACYAVFVKNGKIVDAAPIAKRWIGKPVETFERWVFRRRGKIQIL